MKQQKMYNQYMYSYPHKNAYYEIEEEIVLKAVSNLKTDKLTLYIHIPFCSSKCGYCNLFSIPTAKESSLIENYIEALCRQIKQYSQIIKKEEISFSSLVIGGGTPLILSIDQMQKLFNTLKEQLNIDTQKVNFMIETSPNETEPAKVAYLKSIGVNRISIGVQSFVQEELDSLYRRHTVESCKKALMTIKKENFDCVNIDLIYGTHGQTVDSLMNSIHQVVSYQPEEIFLYPLYVRENTGLFNKMEVNEVLQQQLYDAAIKELSTLGYYQTSMRRFVKRLPKSEVSCGFEQMLALGCGGRSYIGNIHFCEPYDSRVIKCQDILKTYTEKEDFFKGLKGYELDKEEMERRYIIKNLGYYEGIDLNEYEQIFNKDLVQTSAIWKELIAQHLIKIENNRVKLTKQGMGQSDRILTCWISDKVKERMGKC